MKSLIKQLRPWQSATYLVLAVGLYNQRIGNSCTFQVVDRPPLLLYQPQTSHLGTWAAEKPLNRYQQQQSCGTTWHTGTAKLQGVKTSTAASQATGCMQECRHSQLHLQTATQSLRRAG